MVAPSGVMDRPNTERPAFFSTAATACAGEKSPVRAVKIPTQFRGESLESSCDTEQHYRSLYKQGQKMFDDFDHKDRRGPFHEPR